MAEGFVQAKRTQCDVCVNDLLFGMGSNELRFRFRAGKSERALVDNEVSIDQNRIQSIKMSLDDLPDCCWVFVSKTSESNPFSSPEGNWKQGSLITEN